MSDDSLRIVGLTLQLQVAQAVLAQCQEQKRTTQAQLDDVRSFAASYGQAHARMEQDLSRRGHSLAKAGTSGGLKMTAGLHQGLSAFQSRGEAHLATMAENIRTVSRVQSDLEDDMVAHAKQERRYQDEVDELKRKIRDAQTQQEASYV